MGRTECNSKLKTAILFGTVEAKSSVDIITK